MVSPEVAELDSTDVPRNGILSREVLVEGAGPNPLPTHEVTVHYEIFLPDGTLIDSTIKRAGYPFQFAADKGHVIKGLCEAVLTMRIGEKTRFTIHGDFAFGGAGAGHDVPPNTTLTAEVELLAFSERQRELKEMSADELMLHALDLKVEGNRCVQAGDFRGAAKAYKDATDALGQDCLKIYEESEELAEVEGPLQAYESTRQAIALNYSLALFRLGEFSHARIQAEVVLKKDPENMKALYRKSQALMGLGFLDEAKEILLSIAKRDPGNREVRETFEDCKQKLAASNKRDKEAFSAMFTVK